MPLTGAEIALLGEAADFARDRVAPNASLRERERRIGREALRERISAILRR